MQHSLNVSHRLCVQIYSVVKYILTSPREPVRDNSIAAKHQVSAGARLRLKQQTDHCKVRCVTSCRRLRFRLADAVSSCRDILSLKTGFTGSLQYSRDSAGITYRNRLPATASFMSFCCGTIECLSCALLTRQLQSSKESNGELQRCRWTAACIADFCCLRFFDGAAVTAQLDVRR